MGFIPKERALIWLFVNIKKKTILEKEEVAFPVNSWKEVEQSMETFLLTGL